MKRWLPLIKFCYLGVLILLTSIFVGLNWNRCCNFQSLSGYNILFCFWILLLLLPFVKSLTIGGQKLESGLLDGKYSGQVSDIKEDLGNISQKIDAMGKNIKESKKNSNKKRGGNE